MKGNNVTKELIELKYKVMMKRIVLLQNIFLLLSKEEERKIALEKLQEIRMQYEKTYLKIIREQNYEKYEDVEKIVVTYVAKLESKLEKYTYETASNVENVIVEQINEIKASDDYVKFENIDSILTKVYALEELLKKYMPYISKEIYIKLQNAIIELKFYSLLKKQIIQLIFYNEKKKNALIQYKNEDERAKFEALLISRINATKQKEKMQMDKKESEQTNKENQNGNEVEKLAKAMLKEDGANVLNHFLIFEDAKQNVEDYIQLLRANVFNPHKCNIDSDPYYYDSKIIEDFRQYEYPNDGNCVMDITGSVVAKANFSVLYALLKECIGEKDTSIIECDRIYRKCGFRCNPICENETQKYIAMLFLMYKNTKQYEELFRKTKSSEDHIKRKLYKLKICPLNYWGPKVSNDSKTDENAERSFLENFRNAKKEVQSGYSFKTWFKVPLEEMEVSKSRANI